MSNDKQKVLRCKLCLDIVVNLRTRDSNYANYVHRRYPNDDPRMSLLGIRECVFRFMELGTNVYESSV